MSLCHPSSLPPFKNKTFHPLRTIPVFLEPSKNHLVLHSCSCETRNRFDFFYSDFFFVQRAIQRGATRAQMMLISFWKAETQRDCLAEGATSVVDSNKALLQPPPPLPWKREHCFGPSLIEYQRPASNDSGCCAAVAKTAASSLAPCLSPYTAADKQLLEFFGFRNALESPLML